MFTPKQLKLFTQRTNNLRFFETDRTSKKYRYRLLYLGENIDFITAFNNFHFLINEMKLCYLPKINAPLFGIRIGKSITEFVKKIRSETSLIAYINRGIIESKKQNYIIDTELLINMFFDKFKTRNLKKIYAYNFYKFLMFNFMLPASTPISSKKNALIKDEEELKEYYEDDIYYNTIIYTIDVSKYVEPTFYSKLIFPLAHFWLRQNERFPIPIHYIILSIINSKENKKPIFIKIYDHELLQPSTYYVKWFSIIKPYLKKLEKENEEYVTQDIEKQVSNIISKDTNTLVKIYQESLEETLPENVRKNLELHNVQEIKQKVTSGLTKIIKKFPGIKDTLQKLNDKDSEINSEIKEFVKLGIYAISIKYELDRNDKLAEKQLDTLFKIAKNRTVSNKLTLKDKELKRYFSNVIFNNIQRVIDRYTFRNISVDPVSKNIDLIQLSSNKIPNDLFYKRQVDFTKQIKNDLVQLFSTLNKRTDYPLYFDNIEETIMVDPYEIRKTYTKRYRVSFKDKEGRIHKVDINLPVVFEDGTMLINGHKKVMVNQLVLNPVYFPKPFIAKIITFFSTIQIENRPFKVHRYLQVRAMSAFFPFILLLAVIRYKQGGLKKVFDDLGYKYELVNAKTNRNKVTELKRSEEHYFLLFDNNDYLFVNKNMSPLQLSLFNALKKIQFKIYKITGNDFFNPEKLDYILLAATKKENMLYRLNFFVESFIDNVTKQILELNHLPSSIYELLLYVATKIQEPYVDERNDLKIQRIRTSEVFTFQIYKQILHAYYQYVVKRNNGIMDAKLDLKSDKVFKSIANSQLTRMYESANPVEELSILTRVTFVGPGGLSTSEGATAVMRSVHPSYFGQISPTDVPEGGNVGVVQHLTVNAMLKDIRGNFLIKQISNQEKAGILSLSDVFTPFGHHNEATRNLMAANQVRQALPLDNKEPPLIQTGYETILTNYLSDNFIKKSPIDGQVISISNKGWGNIKIKDSKTGNIVKVDLRPERLFSGQAIHSVSYFEPKVKVGDKVKKQQLIAEGASIVDGTISLGKNLLTAYMSYRGYNFEDGIIINANLLDRKELYSTHVETIEIFIEPNSDVIITPFHGNINMSQSEAISNFFNTTNSNGGISYKSGQIMFSFVPDNISQYVMLDEDSIGDNGTVNVVAEHDGRIIDIEVYPNIDISKNSKINQLYKICKEKNPERYEGLIPGEFKYRKEKYLGTYIVVHFEYKESGIAIGNKYCNRHGNKGTICLIEDKMPVTPWGQEIDIIVNPLGVISRMNIGQKYELYLGLISNKMREILLKNRSKQSALKLIKEIYYNLLDSSPGKIVSSTMMKVVSKMSSKQYSEFLDRYIRKRKGLSMIFPNFTSPDINNIYRAMSKLGLKDSYILDLPALGPNVKTKLPVAVGYIYFYKLEHVAMKKIASRSEGRYLSKYLQPTAGKKREGGQRVGEFDSWALFSYGATNIIREFFGPLSDDMQMKNEMIRKIIENGEVSLSDIKTFKTGTRDLLRAYFYLMGLDIQ